MPSLGGSIFVRNAIKYDYCLEASIESLLPLCDPIVVLDCQSDDGTTELLRAFAAKHPKVKLVENVIWECAPNYERLKILANLAIDCLQTDWHFMIQADEVLHENGIPVIQQAIKNAPDHLQAFSMRRIHLFGNIDHYIRHDIPTQRKPSSDVIIRLARRGIHAHGDAESLLPQTCDHSLHNNIHLFHYSYVRKNAVNISRVIDMQTWFHGPNSEPDPRVVAMKNKDNIYRPEAFFSWDELAPLYMPHPACAKAWVDERRAEFPPRPISKSLL